MDELVIKNLSISHRGGVLAVSNFSLLANKGEIVILTGPIGSGKSSIFRAVCGLLPYEGEIIWCGQNIKNCQIKDRNFAYASFDSPLIKHKTVEYNLAYGSILRKTERESIARRIKEVCNEFNISALLNRKVKNLTYYECRLVIIARAFIRNVQLRLINEPTRGLNDEETAFILEKIISLQKQSNAAMLISSSDYTAATGLKQSISNNNIVLIKDGIKICEGNTRFFRSTPPDLFTALFTSDSLFFVVKVRSKICDDCKIFFLTEESGGLTNIIETRNYAEIVCNSEYKKIKDNTEFILGCNESETAHIAIFSSYMGDINPFYNSSIKIKRLLVFDSFYKKLLCIYEQNNML